MTQTQRADVAETVVLARLEQIYVAVDRDADEFPPSEDDLLVLLLLGQGVDDAVRSTVRTRLRFPITEVRADSAEIEVTYGTAYTGEGEPFRYTSTARDRESGLPVMTFYVDSLRSRWPGRAYAQLAEAHVEGTHYQASEWWLSRTDGRWIVDSTLVIWTN